MCTRVFLSPGCDVLTVMDTVSGSTPSGSLPSSGLNGFLDIDSGLRM